MCLGAQGSFSKVTSGLKGKLKGENSQGKKEVKDFPEIISEDSWLQWKCPGFLLLNFSHSVTFKGLKPLEYRHILIFFKVSVPLKAKINYWLIKGD